jgi:hypothetical protein
MISCQQVQRAADFGWGFSFTPLNNPLFTLMDVFKLPYAN